MAYGFDNDEYRQLLEMLGRAGGGNLMGAPAANVGVPVAPQSQAMPPGMAPRATPYDQQLAELQDNRMDMGKLIPALALMNIGTALQTRKDLRPAVLSQLPGTILNAYKAQGDAAKEKALLNLQAKYYGAQNKSVSTDQLLAAAIQSGDQEMVDRITSSIREKKPEPLEKPMTRTIQRGNEKVTQEYDFNTRSWSDVAAGPAWNPKEREPRIGLTTGPNGEQVYAEITPGMPGPKSFKETEAKEDKRILSQMLVDGEMTPETLSKRGDYNTIIAGAKKIDPKFTPAQLSLKWHGAKRWLSSLSSPQQARLEAAGVRVIQTVDEVKALAEQMKLSGFQPANKAEILAKMQLAGNTPQGQLATRYVTAVNDLKEVFATAANGGYAPTDSVWRLANSQINENFGVKQMESSLDELQRLMRININAGKDMRTGAGVWPGGGTGQGPAATQQVAPGAGNQLMLPKNGQMVPVDQATYDAYQKKWGIK